MPEIRYITTYEYPKDLPSEQRTPDKAKITQTAFTVSDEELAEEKKSQRLANILNEIDSLKAIVADHEARLIKDISGHIR